MSKQRRIPTPSWQRDTGAGSGLESDRVRKFAIAGIALIAVAAIALIGFAYLSDYIEDQNRPESTAIKIGDREYTVEDFTERVKLSVEQSGGSGSANAVIPTVSNQLLEEAILLDYASEKEVDATEEEIKEEIATLDARYQEELTSSGLSDEEYRGIARGAALRTNMLEKFKSELPAVEESAHYRVIQVADQATAEELQAQVAAGADFAELAKTHSLDTTTKEGGGDAGWAPRGFLTETQENIIFSLQPNETAIYPSAQAAFLYQLLEKSEAHEIEEEKREVLASADYNDWLTEKQESLDIENDMDGATGDRDKIRYVIDQADLTLQ
jgi:parvulin-like peptidyl-prolyl isomerase